MAGEISLSAAERDALRDELARIYQTRPAAAMLLEKLSIELSVIPVRDNQTPMEWWSEVFRVLNAGKVSFPYHKLVYYAIEDFAHNSVIRPIAVRHGVIPRDPKHDAEPERLPNPPVPGPIPSDEPKEPDGGVGIVAGIGWVLWNAGTAAGLYVQSAGTDLELALMGAVLVSVGTTVAIAVLALGQALPRPATPQPTLGRPTRRRPARRRPTRRRPARRRSTTLWTYGTASVVAVVVVGVAGTFLAACAVASTEAGPTASAALEVTGGLVGALAASRVSRTLRDRGSSAHPQTPPHN